MDRASVLKELKVIMDNECATDGNKVVESANFRDDLGIDSIDVINTMKATEREFEIEIDDDEVGNLKTVKDIVDLVMKKTAGQ